MKKVEESNSNQANSNTEDTGEFGDGMAIGDSQIHHRYKIIVFEENTILILFVVLCALLWAVFGLTTKLPAEDILSKHDLVSRVVCDKVLPFADEISKETTFSKYIRKIEVLDDGVEVFAVLDETTIGMPNDIKEIELSTEVKDKSIIRLSGQVVVKDVPNDQVGTGFKYEVLGDKITVEEISSAIKPFEYSFSMESGISTWKGDVIAQFALAGLRSLLCILFFFGICYMTINGINSILNLSNRKRNQEEVTKRQINKTFFLNIARLLGILALVFFIILLIDNAYM